MKPIRHLVGSSEEELAIGPSFKVALLQRSIMLDGDEAILESMPLADVIVDIAGSDDADSKLIGQGCQAAIALSIAVDAVLLQLQEVAPCSKEVSIATRGLASLREPSCFEK